MVVRGVCQCPLGLIPHFYGGDRYGLGKINLRVNALSGLYLISTIRSLRIQNHRCFIVSMPSRAYTSFLLDPNAYIWIDRVCVNALSGLYLISTSSLISGSEGVTEGVNALSGLYLISTTISKNWRIRQLRCVNALSGLYLISTVPLQKPRFYAVSRACFCRYLSEYSDNSSFACMLTFWTYLMRCTYP